MSSSGVKDGARVLAVAEIGDLRLFESGSKRRIRNASEAGDNATVKISHGARLAGDPSTDGRFFVIAGVEATVNGLDPKAAPLVQVKVAFEVSYRLPEGFKASRKELEAFARTNAVFNVWPYCREFIQATTARMGLPQIVLPLFRLSQATAAVPAKALPKVAAP